jgi:hypothetical protein
MTPREEALISEYRPYCEADDDGQYCCCPACCAYCLQDAVDRRLDDKADEREYHAGHCRDPRS